MEIGPLLMLVINQKCQDVTGKSQVKKQTKKNKVTPMIAVKSLLTKVSFVYFLILMIFPSESL